MVSFGDTWEWDPGTHSWSQLQPTASPGVRHDLGLVWDSSRNKAVLFGGMQKDTAGVDGIPMQDTWEWDPTAGTWTERTTQGNKPSPRYAHSMAFAGAIKKAIVFGGWDISTGGSLDDLWEWDPVSGSWTARWDGTETNTPLPRMYASLVSDDAKARLELMAGATSSNMYYGTGGMGGIPISPPGMPSPYGWQGTREVWEIDTTTYACQDRSAPSNTPLRARIMLWRTTRPQGRPTSSAESIRCKTLLMICGSGTARPGPRLSRMFGLPPAPTPDWPTIQPGNL